MGADVILRLCEPLGRRVVSFYAIAEDDGWTLFDAGLPGSMVRRIDSGELEGPVRRVIVSHADADHLGDASALHSRGAEILCHPLDRDWVEDHDRLVQERYVATAAACGVGYSPETVVALREMCGPNVPVARTLEDGDRLAIGRGEWRVLHVPGHTHGHIALWRERDGVLIIGDAVLGLAIPDSEGAPSMPPTHRYITEYLDTIEKLGAVPARRVLSGHWPPLDRTAFRRLLAESRQCVERDLETVRSCPPETGGRELIEAICGRGRLWPEAEDSHYCFPVCGYVEHLRAEAANA